VEEALAEILKDEGTVEPDAGEDTVTETAHELALSSQGMNNRARERRRFLLR
jgi:hypothetical protein